KHQVNGRISSVVFVCVEAVSVFPLPGDAAVCHFSAKIGQTEIVAEAREEYDDALSSGQAFLSEESDQSPDIFSLSVGSLRPGESASIRLEYVTELAVQADEGLRFCLPAVLNPRYQPQVWGEGVPSQASLVLYSLSFSAQVSSPRPVSKVESNCPLDALQYLNTEQTQATVKLASGHKFDRDVELLIYYKDAHQPTAVVEVGQASAKPGTLMGDPVVMLSLYPEFPQAVMSSVTSCGEFVFLLDRSGSMGGARIKSARVFIIVPLTHLPMEVENTEEVINLMKRNSGSHRCFSFGIGKGASSALINGLAKEGGGHAQFITGTDRMEPKVMRFALQPAVVDISVKWDLPKGVSVTALSPPITALFQGQRSLVYAQLTGQVRAAFVFQKKLIRTNAKYHLITTKGVNLWNSCSEEMKLSWCGVFLPACGQNQLMQFKCCSFHFPLSDITDVLYLLFILDLHRINCMSIEHQLTPREDLLQLVSLQKASGCWVLDPALAAALGKTSKEVENTKPSAVSHLWATILALIWLHGFKMDAQEEWELLAMKTVSWLRAQNALCVTECVEAGNALLGCSMQKDALGL
uniref:VIT domain-containing protein n=1 Tax=Sander lucioperca TaxID=283035 RepID=A0A8C9Y8I2_SANLU